MPIYEYECPSCGAYAEYRPVSDHDKEGVCPKCSSVSKRIASVPKLAIMTAANRKAWEHNERAVHEPKKVTLDHHCSHGSCGHAHEEQPKRGKGVYQQNRPTSRPWMLGH